MHLSALSLTYFIFQHFKLRVERVLLFLGYACRNNLTQEGRQTC